MGWLRKKVKNVHTRDVRFDFLVSATKKFYESQGRTVDEETLVETSNAYLCPRGCGGFLLDKSLPVPRCPKPGQDDTTLPWPSNPLIPPRAR